MGSGATTGPQKIDVIGPTARTIGPVSLWNDCRQNGLAFGMKLGPEGLDRNLT